MKLRIRSASAGLAFAALATIASTAAAQDPGRLPKDAVETLVVGKEVRYTRASDGSVVTWDVRKDGSIWFTPKTQRAITIGGEYKVEDDGGLCIKWRDDKYVRMTDGCTYFVRDGDRTVLTGKRSAAVYGTVVE